MTHSIPQAQVIHREIVAQSRPATLIPHVEDSLELARVLY